MRIHLVLQRPHLLQRELVQLLVEPGLHGRVVGAQVVHRLNDPLHLLHALALTGPTAGGAETGASMAVMMRLSGLKAVNAISSSASSTIA